MAYTKVFAIRSRLDRSVSYAANEKKTGLNGMIEYVVNRSKTEQRLFETAINCQSPQTAYREMCATKERWHKTGGVLGYTDAAGHQPGDWIIDVEPTTDSEGSKHKECEVCGETLETEEIEKIYNQSTTDEHGEAIVGGYLVTVTDTDTTNPVANATVTLHEDDTLSVLLPSGRLLDYADQTTVTVQLVEDKSPVADMFIAVTDRNDNYCEDTTDASGQITVPGTTGKTNEDGDATVGYEDEDGDKWTLTVTVEDHETGRPIEGAEVYIGKTGNITVTLPDGEDMDENNRITITVTDNKREPQEGVTVIVKGDLGQSERGETDEDGKLTVPAVTESEYHGIYIVG